MSGDRPNDLVDRAYDVGAFAVANPAAADPAAVDPAAAVDRRGTIRALGIIQIVLGGICSLLAVVMVAVAVVGKQGPAAMFGMLVYGLPAANLLATGIGSVKISRWARRGTLISAGIWLALMLLSVAGLLVGVGAGMGGGEAGIAAVIMVPMLLVVVALPIVLLVFYTRPSVRATFERRPTA